MAIFWLSQGPFILNIAGLLIAPICSNCSTFDFVANDNRNDTYSADVAFSAALDMKYQCSKRWWKFQKAMQCDESWRHIVLLGVNRHKRYMALLSVNDVTLPFVSRVTSRHLSSLRWGGTVLQEMRRTITIYNFDSEWCLHNNRNFISYMTKSITMSWFWYRVRKVGI